MSLIEFAVPMMAVGVLLWLLNMHVPVDAKIRKIINGAVVLLVR